ncbi:MAG: iron-sulfur cluster assembly accessory protein, partial [Nitrospirae bacterium]|nr:iron-sulfur cluster assembly accessory protein [Nitrospirota bacterium]
MITLSEKAAEMIRAFMVSENKEGCGLRIGVSGGGCGG